MQMLVYRLGQRRPDAGRAAQVLDSGAKNALQPAEMPQQRAAPRWPEPGDRLQHRGLAGPGALPAMTADRKSVGFVARALYQVQGFRVRRQYRGALAPSQENALLSGATICAFRDGRERRDRQFELLQHRYRLLELALAAVNQQQVGQHQRFLLASPIASRQRLAQRPIVVAALNALDVVAPVVRLDRALRSEHDAGGICRLALRVADVEALDAFN